MDPLENVKNRIKNGNMKVSGMAKTILNPLVLTVQEVRAIAESNLSHPLSSDLLVSVGAMPDSREVTISMDDAKGILENRAVEIEETLEPNADGTKHRRVFRKKLGGPLGNPVEVPPVIHNRKDDPQPVADESEEEDEDQT